MLHASNELKENKILELTRHTLNLIGHHDNQFSGHGRHKSYPSKHKKRYRKKKKSINLIRLKTLKKKKKTEDKI